METDHLPEREKEQQNKERIDFNSISLKTYSKDANSRLDRGLNSNLNVKARGQAIATDLGLNVKI